MDLFSLKKSFSDTITDQKIKIDILNYRFSKLGDITFHPISVSECEKHVKNLNAKNH